MEALHAGRPLIVSIITPDLKLNLRLLKEFSPLNLIGVLVNAIEITASSWNS